MKADPQQATQPEERSYEHDYPQGGRRPLL